jgi:hypothetical protein
VEETTNVREANPVVEVKELPSPFDEEAPSMAEKLLLAPAEEAPAELEATPAFEEKELPVYVKDTAGAAQEEEGVAAGDVELRERGIVGEVIVVHLKVEEAVAEAGLEALVKRRNAFHLVQRMAVKAAKELLFNKDGSAIKRMQAGVDKLADLVGVTLGPKGRNVVLESKYGSPKIVNDGVTVAKEVELEDAVENIGAKLVRQAAAKTKLNDLAGNGTTTSVVAAGANLVQITKGIYKTVVALVKELKKLSKEVEDSELADVAAVSASHNPEVGKMIAQAARWIPAIVARSNLTQ